MTNPAPDTGRTAEEMRDWSGFSGCGVHQVRGSKADIDLVKRWCEQAATIPALQERIRSTQKLLADCQQKLRTTEATVAVARALNEAAEAEAAQLRSRLLQAEKGAEAMREAHAKLVETFPEQILAWYSRGPGSPPGNGYRATTRADLAAAIRGLPLNPNQEAGDGR